MTVSRGELEVQVIDIQDRERFRMHHRPGAIDIHFDELSIRAKDELNSILDCTLREVPVCEAAAFKLGFLGFSKVSVLNVPGTPEAVDSRG